jgi:hypothetical protein
MSPEPQHARPHRMPPLAVRGPVTPLAPRLTRRGQRRARREERHAARQQATEARTARRQAADWTRAQRLYTAALTAASLATAGPAGYEIYRTSTDLARPYLSHQAWILPVACEAAYMALFGWGILLAWRKMADIPARLAGTVVIAALSFAIQVYAGRHSAGDVMVRLAIVASFFVTGLTMKAAFMRIRGGKIRPDRLGLGEWLASPARAAGLWRWKNAWAEPSAVKARQRYLVLLYVISLAQSDPRVGKRLLSWRRNLPVTLRYELSTGLLPPAIAAGEGDWQEAAQEHVEGQLSLLPPLPPDDAENDTPPRQEDDSADDTVADTADASQDDSGTPGRQPAARQRTRQPSASERARQTATVKRLLDRHGDWTLAQVAEKAGVSERTVSRIKNAPASRPKPLSAVK